MNSEIPAGAFLGIPKDYVFLLVGMAIGFLLGWLAARLTGGGPREIGQVQEPSPAPPAAPGQAISVVVNNRRVNLEPAQAEEIQGMIHERRMIDAVKRLRAITGLNHAEAKAVAESLAQVGH